MWVVCTSWHFRLGKRLRTYICSAIVASCMSTSEVCCQASFSLSHIGLNVSDVIGNAFLPQESTSVGCDEYIIFDAYASEVLVRLEKVEVNEFLVDAFLSPFIDESGYEIDARFVAHDNTFLKTSATTQAVGAELFEVGACFFVETHVCLSKAFH